MIIGTNSAQEIVEFAPSPLSCDCGFSNHSKALASLLSGKNRTNICIYIPQCWMVVPFFTAIDSQWPQLNGLWKNRVKIFLNVLLFIATSIYRPCIGSIKWLFECAFWFMLVWISSVVNYCLCSASNPHTGFWWCSSGWQELDIAVVKATNHVETPPKEKHVRSEPPNISDLQTNVLLLGVRNWKFLEKYL